MALRLSYGKKELLRIKVLEMVKQGKITLKTAVKMLCISYRQGIRLYNVYRKEGASGLIHGNSGKKSNNRTAEPIRAAALFAYCTKYRDFGPTIAAEKLLEIDKIKISVSVLRRLLIEAGEWKCVQHRKKPHERSKGVCNLEKAV